MEGNVAVRVWAWSENNPKRKKRIMEGFLISV